MPLLVLDTTASLQPAQLGWLIEMANRALTALSAAGEVRVRIVRDGEMAAAHQKFSGVEGTTDVLTFDLSPEAPSRKPEIADLRSGFGRIVYALDSDILVCRDEARRVATQGGYPIEKELLLYIIHGVLHCLGWDDHDDAEAAAMHELEDAVLELIGVGAVFGPGQEPPAARPG